jgi:Chaperone of endosialidase
MAVPYTFGSATTSIPLSQLDSNFATAITLGNTAVQLGNTITTLTGVTNLASGGALTLGSNGNTTAVYVDTSQNVGIGTASPSSRLHTYTASGGNKLTVEASATSQQAVVSLVTNATTPGQCQLYMGKSGATTNGQVGYDPNSDYMYFYTSNSERMRIDSSGNLLIGVTSSSYGGGIFLQKSNQGNTIANFENTYAGSGGQAIRAKINPAGNNTASYLFVGASNNDVFYIYGNGNAVNSNNSYGGISDVKLKDNIVDATPKLADVMQLKVRNFNFKTDPDHKQIGFIAQELEEVFPALIDNTTSPDDPNDVTKAIKTSVLIPILVKAIQELKAINDTQAETINALTARIVALEAK